MYFQKLLKIYIIIIVVPIENPKDTGFLNSKSLL